jgi:uncharacterized protein GlcG (DUF336 family)
MAKDGGYGRLVMKAAKAASDEARRQGRPVTTSDINRHKQQVAAARRSGK